MYYRRDIDGLRAVAVGSVLAFHLDPSWASGGFVGVDVFFVISGFLILRIIDAEIREGRFSLTGFYDRRIRRIAPALILILILTTIAALLLFLPHELELYGKSLVSAVFAVSNIFFWRATNGYFAPAAEEFSLLHTWSLGVEEQFYLIVPLIMLLVARHARRWLGVVMWAMLAGSFALSVWGVMNKPDATFYLLPTRAWELLIGGVLALRLVPEPRNHWQREAGAGLGLAGILCAILLYSGSTPFPGPAAALPCVGTGLVIWSGLGSPERRPLAARMLCLKVFVFIGLISYSLYLWHWPLIVFAKRLTVHPLGTEEKLVVAFVAIALAAASWKWVEQPFRRGLPLFSTRQSRAVTTACLAIVLTVTGITFPTAKGLPLRIDPGVLAISNQTQDYSNLSAKCLMDAPRMLPFEETCVIGANQTGDVVVLADSHGISLGHALAEIAGEHGKSVRFLATRACPPALGFEESGTPGCAQHVARLVSELGKQPPRTVVIAAFYFSWLGTQQEDAFWTGMEHTVSTLAKQGHRIVLLGAVPPYEGGRLPNDLARWIMTGNDMSDFAYHIDPRGAASISERLSSLAETFRTDYVRLLPTLCSETGRCRATLAGHVLLFDTHHLTVGAARVLAREKLAPAIFQYYSSALERRL